MEGNVWLDEGSGRFRSDTGFGFGYSQLDRYLMGFIPSAAVQPFFFIRDAGGWNCSEAQRGREINPAYYPPTSLLGQQTQVSGERVDVSIDMVLGAEGERDPGFERARKKWTMVFILAARENDTVDDRVISQIDQLRRSWERAFERDDVAQGGCPPIAVAT